MKVSRFLQQLWEQRDEVDYGEGLQAYARYNTVMHLFAMYYDFPLDEVVSAFVALSPNNDYHGNLRSLASVLDGKNKGVPLERITVSTYNACRDRAYSYLGGAVSFVDTVKGPKTRAFRDNILRPDRSPLVTVDGHMVCAWNGVEMTMKQAQKLMSPAHYRHISADIQEIAVCHDLVPCQVQAVLWFTRKRLLRIKFNAHPSLFNPGDTQNVLCSPGDYPPYEPKQEVRTMHWALERPDGTAPATADYRIYTDGVTEFGRVEFNSPNGPFTAIVGGISYLHAPSLVDATNWVERRVKQETETCPQSTPFTPSSACGSAGTQWSLPTFGD